MGNGVHERTYSNGKSLSTLTRSAMDERAKVGSPLGGRTYVTTILSWGLWVPEKEASSVKHVQDEAIDKAE
ncbi:hypothetical protein PAXINDRAFT_166330 [Paxillus involutus ATCC 200175]|nr:hypothetical protein PAXINDRAFT_166330 [Paxillus involutus ATCC 200175]